MKKFISINRDGVSFELCWFCVKSEYPQPDGDNIIVDEFTVRPSDRNLIGIYTLQVLDIGAEAKILSQTRDEGKGVKGKGICEAMLPELREFYKKPIISSSKLSPIIPGENRVERMTGIYKEIEANGIVRYEASRDVFIFPAD